MTSMDFLSYIYINEPEIDRLYAQSVEWVTSERQQSDKQILKGDVSAKMFGTGVDVGGNKETEYTDKKKLSFHHKVKYIVSELASSNNIFKQIEEAIKITESGRRIYIDLKMPFTAPEFKNDDAIETLNKEGHIILEGKINQTNIIMSLGLEHMPRLRGHEIRKTSHDAILFREITDHEYYFFVFGLLYKISQNKFQIKPITVSL